MSDDSGDPFSIQEGLSGFQVRSARPAEVPALLSFFPENPLGSQKVLCVGAFGVPGNLPLGAAIVRPLTDKTAHFLIFVRREFRRRKIGTMLMRKLYALALSNQAEKLIVPLLIHQNDPDIAFYTAVGLAPERSFATYSIPIQRGLKFCQPLLARFQPRMDADQISIQPLATLPLDDIADFFCTHFGGFADQRSAELRSGHYELSLACAAVRNGKIIAANLGRTRPDISSAFLEVIVVVPDYRNGFIPLAILAYSARLALQRNLTHCVFEADEQYDRFAVGFARRCGAKAESMRFRYSIGREQMKLQTMSLPA